MLKRYATKARIGMWGGYASLIVIDRLLPIGSAVLIISLACGGLFTWGCVLYTRAKGQSPWFGTLALIGLFAGTFLGLIYFFYLTISFVILILVLLPDKYKDNPDGEPPIGPPPPPYHPPVEEQTVPSETCERG